MDQPLRTDAELADRRADPLLDLAHLYEEVADPNFRAGKGDFVSLVEHQLDTGRRTKRYGPAELLPETIYREAIAGKPEGISNDGAYAMSSFLNGEVPEHFNRNQVRALSSAMNEMPLYPGEVIRTINYHGNSELAMRAAANYPPNGVVVEAHFTRWSGIPKETPVRPGDGEVVFHIQPKTGRDLRGLSQDSPQPKVLFKPGTQVKITKNTKVSFLHSNGREVTRWVIEGQELAKGDSGYLDVKAVKQKLEKHQADTLNNLRTPAESVDSPPKPENAWISGEPKDGWGALNGSSRLLRAPAIHADSRVGSRGTVSYRVQFLLLQRLFGGAAVNPGFYSDHGLEQGFRNNYVESVLAFEHYLQGKDAIAEPNLLDTNRSSFTLGNKAAPAGNRISEGLGNKQPWKPSEKGLASAIEYMINQPLGSRAALVYSFESENKIHEYSAVAVTTQYGVVLVDPVRNRLLQVPKKIFKANFLPYHIGDGQPVSP